MTADDSITLLQTLITCLAHERYKHQRTEAVDMLNALRRHPCSKRLRRQAEALIERYSTDSAQALFLVETEVSECST